MFEIPKDLTALDRGALDAAISEALKEAKSFEKEDNLSDDQFQRLVALADFVSAAREHIAQTDKAEKERADKIAAARKALSQPAPEQPKQPEEQPKPDTKPAPADPEPEPAPQTEPEKEVVTASARLTNAAARAARTAPPAEPPANGHAPVTIVAAADALGLTTGQELTDLDAVAKAAEKRFQAMPKGTATSERYEPFGLAEFHLNRADGLVLDSAEYRNDIQRLLRDAADETRLPGGSLVAAAGWCAPSETLYGLSAGLESTAGIWDVPSINVSRGGISYTKGPSIKDVFNHAGFFSYTEAQVIAGTNKPCYSVPCPAFTEVRLDARGVCIKAGILQEKGYPEIIRRYIELSLVAHQHQTSAWLLTKAQTLAGTAIAHTNVWPNTVSIFTALELLALGYREELRMDPNATLEVVVPFWLRAAVRADYANQAGMGPEVVTDAMVDRHFAERNFRVQYVYNYQALPRVSGNVVDFPATVEALVYPAGTFVKLQQDIISLQTLYDSTNLAANEYTALFTEEGVALANTAYDAKRVTIPVAVTGLTAAGNINRDWGGTAVAYTTP